MSAKTTNNDLASLVSELTCDSAIRCQRARRALVKIGKPAVPALVDALRSDRQMVRWEAAKALGMIADPAATEALVAALSDAEFGVRWVAAEALTRQGPVALAPLLRALTSRSASKWLRESAHHVLADMEMGHMARVMKPVVDALDGPHPPTEAPVAAQKALDAIRESDRLASLA